MSWIILAALLSGSASELSELYRTLDFAWTSDAPTGRELIAARGGSIVFSAGVPVALINGVPRRMEQAPRIEGGKLVIPAELAEEVRRIAEPRGRALEPAAAPVDRSRPRFPPCSIVLDPGHGRGGENHTGGVGKGGLMEKDVTLDIGLRLQGVLEEAGAKVVMTRTGEGRFVAEKYADLQHRVDVAQAADPDLLLSIHVNWAENSMATGYEVWVPAKTTSTRDRACRELARRLRQELGRVIPTEDRGTKDEKDLYVLRNTTCTAVMAELDFISNAAVERRLSEPGYRQKIAEALAEALRGYLEARR